jgi:hypothetical protein
MSIPSPHPSSASSSHTRSLIPIPKKKRYHLPTLKADIQKVVDARGSTYTTSSALLIMWEADDTNAESDILSMSALFAESLVSHLFLLESPGSELFPIGAEQLFQSVRSGYVPYPDFDVEDIKDESKSDGLAS